MKELSQSLDVAQSHGLTDLTKRLFSKSIHYICSGEKNIANNSSLFTERVYYSGTQLFNPVKTFMNSSQLFTSLHHHASYYLMSY